MKIVTSARHTKMILQVIVFFFTLLSTTALPILMNPPSAKAGSDSYPTSIAGCRYVSNGGSAGTCDLKDSAQDYYYDPWSEENRECTSYAAWMLSSVNGFTMPFYDYAINWGTRAQNLGYTVNMTPAVGSIYWTTNPSPWGHVAYVEAVSTDGSTITTEDYNVDFTGHWAEHTGVSTTSASGYIHFKDTTQLASWVPLAGDWTGKGYKSIGLYNPTTATFMLRNSNTPGNADITTVFGAPNWIPLVGDWNNDGKDTIGVYNPTGTFYLSNYNTNPESDYIAAFGNGGNWIPLAGNWDGYLSTTIGVYNPSTATFYLSNYNTNPESDYIVVYGNGGTWQPVVGDWDGNGTTTIGAYDHTTSTFYLRNSNTSGNADIMVQYGNPN